MQLCGRRSGGETCSYEAAYEVVAGDHAEAQVGHRVCEGCGSLLRRQGVELERLRP